MTIRIEPIQGRRRRSLKRRLAEAQNHHCAVCGVTVETVAFSCSSNRASVVKVDRDGDKSYENCVVACARCAGVAASRYDSLTAFYDAYLDGSAFDSKAKPQIERPDVLVEIAQRVHAMCLADGLEVALETIFVPKGYRFAPPDRAEHIARLMFQKRDFYPRQPKKRPPRFGVERDANKRILLEAQNHRCCYCGTHMNTEYPLHPRYATWEHVVRLDDGGEWRMRNLVIACSICNHTRDLMSLSAEAFYAWAVENLDEIERLAQERLASRKKRNRPFSFKPAKKRLYA